MAFDRLDSTGLSHLWGKIKNYVINTIPIVCYPVGSFYETTVSSFNPNTSLYGTWILDPDMGSMTIDSNASSGTVDGDLAAVIDTMGFTNINTTNAIYRWHRIA